MPKSRSVTQLGIKLRVLIPEERDSPVTLVQSLLRDQGLDADCRKVAPSLEDVFVAVTLDSPQQEEAA